MVQEPIVQHLRRIRIITKNYGVMRGLQGVPFGLVFLVLAVFQFGLLSIPEEWVNVSMFAVSIGFLLSLALSSLIGGYYDRMFGRVQSIEERKLDKTIGMLLVIVLFLAAIRIDNAGLLPVSVTGLAIALWFFIIWWRTHILVIVLFTAAISLLPLAGVSSLSKIFLPFHGGYLLVLGLFFTVGGICDHLILVHTLRELRRVYHDETI